MFDVSIDGKKGIYLRVDSVDKGDTTYEAEQAVREASVIQYIIFFLY